MTRGSRSVGRQRDRGDRLAAAGRLDDAALAYRAALALAPDDPELHTNLGNVLLGLGQAGAALAAYDRALATGCDHPLIHYNRGTALRGLGQAEAALAAFGAALWLAPDYAPAHNNRGNVLRDLGRPGEAAAAYLQALLLRPGDHAAGTNLASALTLLQTRDPGAAQALARRWRALAPQDPMAGHVAAALAGGPVPPRAGDGYVRQLFDGFAPDFDQRLAALDYRVPALIAAALARRWPVPEAALAVLDAGCGTGLCAPRLRPHARTLTGVDLSPEMLARAAARGLYDALEVAELTAFLAAHPGAFDLIVAGDVLCYFGALGAVLAASAAALRPGGALVVTVEGASRDDTAAPAPFTLQPNGRYRHAAGPLAAALEAAGFTEVAVSAVVLRREDERDVPGLLAEGRAGRS